MPLYVSGKQEIYLVCCYFRGWVDWDIEAQQLLRMCQAIRAVQFFKKYLTTSWLLLVTVQMYAPGYNIQGFVSGLHCDPVELLLLPTV